MNNLSDFDRAFKANQQKVNITERQDFQTSIGKDRRLTKSQAKTVSQYLMSCRNGKSGKIFPGYHAIARNCGCSESAAKRAVALLVSTGWWFKQNRKTIKNGILVDDSNMYVPNFEYAKQFLAAFKAGTLDEFVTQPVSNAKEAELLEDGDNLHPWEMKLPAMPPEHYFNDNGSPPPIDGKAPANDTAPPPAGDAATKRQDVPVGGPHPDPGGPFEDRGGVRLEATNSVKLNPVNEPCEMKERKDTGGAGVTSIYLVEQRASGNDNDVSARPWPRDGFERVCAIHRPSDDEAKWAEREYYKAWRLCQGTVPFDVIEAGLRHDLKGSFIGREGNSSMLRLPLWFKRSSWEDELDRRYRQAA